MGVEPRVALPRPLLLLLVLGPACSGACGDEQPRSLVELPTGGGCGEAYVWAATDSGDIAVTVSVEARDRSRTEPTTTRFSVPGDAVEVRILEGRDLPRNLCTDLIDVDSQPRNSQDAVAGKGTITLDPAPDGPDSASCGTVSGVLELTGLEAQDGTTFAPIRVATDSIGCYAG